MIHHGQLLKRKIVGIICMFWVLFLSTHIICLGAQKSRLSETVLLIIHNMYFGFVNLKMILH